MGDIKKMFNPKAIALIGTTEKEDAVSRITLENLLLVLVVVSTSILNGGFLLW
jgi:acyl-CoA synthetase (NDP forming)